MTPDPTPSTTRLFLSPGSRPLPDYELVGLLGRGGFGQVWKAIGPGGFAVALKFVQLGERGTPLELRALELMKEIRHPHLLSLFGAWQRDGWLIVAMELADGTLLDRLTVAQARGEPGLPLDQLLEWTREAARGLDFLNEPRHPTPDGRTGGIQHKDVKPQNLLLVGDAVKVGDFGLVRVLEKTAATTATAACTPAYAAPEFFQGQVTRWMDQYALAVTYCQLRGGRLPFEGGPAQVLAGHLLQPPDLSMLPEAERPAVARALSKAPPDRFPTCRAFVEALAAGAAPSGQRSLAALPVEEEAAISLIGRLNGAYTVGRTGSGQRITKVDLSRTRVTDADLLLIGRLRELRELALENCDGVSDTGLEHLRGLSRLQTLRLRECRGLNDAGLACLEGLTDLQALDLAGTWAPDSSLRQLKGLTALRRLDLTDTWAGNAGLENLAGLTRLQELHLRGCKTLGDPGVRWLGSLTALETLNLIATGVSDAGLASLAGLARLRELRLRRCLRVSDAGLKHLAALTVLQRLDLSGCPEVTAAGVSVLRKALPNLVVVR
jgi:hypothetical protein